MLCSSIGQKGSAPGAGLPVQVDVLWFCWWNPLNSWGWSPLVPHGCCREDIPVVLVLTRPHLFQVKLSL